MADSWDDDVDGLLTDVDDLLYSKYKIHVKDLLNNPYRFGNFNNIVNITELMKSDVDDYINGFIDLMKNEVKKLNDDELKATAVTSQISQTLSLAAKQKNIPIITPVSYSPDQTRTEIILIENNDQNLTLLLQKLIENAILVIDTTIKYENYKFGNWTIITQNGKNYNIQLNINSNMLLKIMQSKKTIDNLFDNAGTIVKEIASAQPSTPKNNKK
ncbi:MAG: hypothetical protein ACP5RI_00850 [Candidatus Micrarchaeia archaeon]